ncbi:unnamed protein product [Closterium sp. NIES-53]
MAPGQQTSTEGMAVEEAEDEGEADLAATASMEAAGVADTAATTRAMDAVAADSTASQEGKGAGGGRGRGRGGRGGRGGGAASMNSAGNESESRGNLFPGQFFFVSTQAPAGPEKDELFEKPAAMGKVTLHSLDYWVIGSGATYSMTPRADLLTELEPSPVKHVTSALWQRAEVKGMGKAMFKGADGKMVGLKNEETKGMGKAMFKGADGKMVGLKNVLWVPSPPPPLFLVPGPPPVDPLPPQGPAPSGVSQVDAVEPVEVTGDSGAAGGAEPWGADSGGAEPGGAAAGGAEPGGAATGGAEPGGAELGGTVLGSAEPGGAATGGAERGGAATGGAEPGGASPGCAAPGGAELRGAPPGGSPGASSLREALSPQELCEWFARRWRRAASAGGSSPTEGAAVAGPGGARTVSTRAAGPASSTGAGAAEGVGTETTAGGPAGGPPSAAGGSGATGGAAREGAPAGGTGAVPAVSGVAARPRPYFVPLLEQVLGSPPSTSLPPSLACPQPVQSQLQLLPTSPLPAPSPYTGPTGGLAERREPASRPASPVRAARTSGRGSRQRPPPVPGTHRMFLRPSTAPLRVPLPSPPESSLPALADPVSDSLRAASPTVTRLLASIVTDPSFESTAASALVTELVDFAASCRLDYAASLVTESESVCPPSVGGECALGTDVLEDRQEEFQCLAAASPHLVTSGMGLVLGGRSPVVLTGHADASWADDQTTQRSSQGYTFSLGSGSVSWRATRSSSVLGSSCEAEIYAGAMAAQELRWLTYLLTDLGEPPRSPPVLYVDNKAMLALCREQRLEHRTKHIALRYFLARELQQRGQLRLAYVASEANTADVFTKALAPCDHQRFCTQLGLVPVLPHLLTS